MIVKVPDDDFDLINKSEQLELFISKKADEGIYLQLHTNIKINRIYNKFFSDLSKKEGEEDYLLLSWLLNQLRIPVSIIDSSERTLNKLIGFSRESRERVKEFLSLKKEKDKPILEKMFEHFPAGVLMPVSTDTGFIFLCKTSDLSYLRFKKQNSIIFDAQIIENKLCLVLSNNGYFMGQLILNKKTTNKKLKEDLKTLLQAPMISFFINNERCKESTKITKIKIMNRDIKKTISEFLESF